MILRINLLHFLSRTFERRYIILQGRPNCVTKRNTNAIFSYTEYKRNVLRWHGISSWCTCFLKLDPHSTDSRTTSREISCKLGTSDILLTISRYLSYALSRPLETVLPFGLTLSLVWYTLKPIRISVLASFLLVFVWKSFLCKRNNFLSGVSPLLLTRLNLQPWLISTMMDSELHMLHAIWSGVSPFTLSFISTFCPLPSRRSRHNGEWAAAIWTRCFPLDDMEFVSAPRSINHLTTSSWNKTPSYD